MAKPSFKYPTGPGTPAWAAFDRALEAYRAAKGQGNLKAIKRYYNQRQYMIDLLRKHHEPVKPWTRALDEAIKELRP
jgi:hypothetical protein